MDHPLVEVQAVSKTFGGVHALSDISLSLRAGEVHALMGENGAGKSTLIKILSGSHSPDSGEVLVGGTAIPPGDVAAAQEAGIAVIHQESVAFLHLDAQDNIFVGREPKRCGGLLLDRARLRSETQKLLDQLGESFDIGCPLADLTLAQRQMVGIARALSRECRLLVMDEPTASLSARETEVLFRIVRQLREVGVGILYVSHRMDEIFELADQVTVLRDGKLVETRAIGSVTREDLIRMMVGRAVGELARETTTNEYGETVLEVKDLSRAGAFQEISFAVRSGEIVGLAGLVGAGRSEVAQSIFGIDRADSGEVLMRGERVPPGSVDSAVKRGIGLVPEDRQHLGLVLPMTVGQNLVLPTLRSLARGGWRSKKRERAVVEKLMGDLKVRAAGPAIAAQTLSGGNQQKLVIGKWLAAKPSVLILDEPTRGVDVGAKAEVYHLIRSLAKDGLATLIISSDLPEILSLCDRILVMRSGIIAGELAGADATQEQILTLALPDAGAMPGDEKEKAA
jgi:ABC-type sugar transport system ATPase subunit